MDDGGGRTEEGGERRRGKNENQTNWEERGEMGNGKWEM